jgi:hypothetical protein
MAVCLWPTVVVVDQGGGGECLCSRAASSILDLNGAGAAVVDINGLFSLYWFCFGVVVFGRVAGGEGEQRALNWLFFTVF